MSRVTNKAIAVNSNINKLNESQLNLIKFLKPFEIDENDADYKEKRNIFNPSIKGKYNIPFKSKNQSMAKFMSLLDQSRKDGTVNHFMELQVSDHNNNIGSGILLDFDLFLESEEDTLTNFKFDMLIHEIIIIMLDILNFNLKEQLEYDDDGSDLIELGISDGALYSIWGIVLKRQGLDYKEDKKLYKNGFHLLFPNVKISKETKRYLISKLIESEKIKSLFRNIGVVNDDYLDRNSSHVPNNLYGSCKMGSIKPHLLDKIYKTVVSNEAIVVDTVNDMISYENHNINLCYEFSLNYVSNKMPVMKLKRYFKPKSDIDTKIRVYNDQTNGNQNIEDVEEVLSNLDDQISLITINNCEINYIKDLLESLSLERINDYNEWRNIIFAIANTSKQLKPLAEWISRRNVEKFNESSFNLLWEQALVKKSDRPLTIRSIIHWSRIDNKERFEEIKNRSVKQLLFNYCSNQITCGSLNHYEYSQLLYALFKEKYVTDYKNNICVWYEFVTNSDQHKKGEIFKWREIGNKPRLLSMYISERLKRLLEEEVIRLHEEIQKCDNKDMIKYFENQIKNLTMSARKLSCSNFKNSILKEAGISFECRNFIKDLNKDQNILGVANGILVLNEFDKDGYPKLIKGAHEYKISSSAPTNYVKYDPNNEYIKKVEALLKSFFLEEEYDSHEFQLLYLASCLDGLPKDNILFILRGDGCHSINTPIMMYDGSIKMVQDVKINDKLMGDDNTPRIVQFLYRGEDTMVKISPKNEKPFIVNINHILSLKKPDGSVLDIKIKELINLDTNFINSLKLYKNNSSTYEFNIEILDKDYYYGFELDKNHRYLTGDCFVHHNSNGKSALLELVLSTLGSEYSIKMPMTFLTMKRGTSQGADPCIMGLENSRVCYYSESDPGDVLSSAKLKEITGNETISARQIYEGQKNFKPNTHHLLITNNRLKIDSTDHGTWRRIFYSEMKIKFTLNPDPNNRYERKADTNFSKFYINDDRYKEAFLSILVKYYVILKKKYNGTLLAVKCPTIRRETQAYRNSEDSINKFINECCVVSSDNVDELTDVVDLFKQWYAKNIGTKLTSPNSYIMDQLKNSRISKYLINQHRGSSIIRDIRFVLSISDKEEDEVYLVDFEEKNE